MKDLLFRFGRHLAANKTTSAIGFIIFLSVLVEAFPKSIGFLPTDLQKQIFDGAHYAIQAEIAAVFFFLRSHTLFPGKPDPSTPKTPPPNPS